MHTRFDTSMTVGILLSRGQHLPDHIISLRGDIGAQIASINL